MRPPPFNQHQALKAAVAVARLSPCMKSQRGVVIFDLERGVLARGTNHRVDEQSCDGSPACRSACAKLCVHAELDALTAYFKPPQLLGKYPWVHMLHVKVVDGHPVPSGPPSCWQCSRHIVNSGIRWMWLLHEDGLKRYTACEFHRLTLEHCELVEPSKETRP